MSLEDLDKMMDEQLSGRPSMAGVPVSEDSALALPIVYACVKVLSETQASLPCHVYRRNADGGKGRANDHSNYSLLHDSPNDEMTAFEFYDTMTAALMLWGNSYASIVRDNGGTPRELWPLLPGCMTPKRERKGDPLQYLYRQGTGIPETYSRDNILHIRLRSKNGITGMSPITQHREAIGLGLAMQEFGARFFGSGTHPGAVAEHPGKLSKPAHDNLEDSLRKSYSSLGKSHQLMVLEEGMKYKEIGIPPEDAQFLQSREYQLVEICRIYRLQPHKVMDLSRATFSNVEHEGISFVVDTIRPNCVRWEQALNKALFFPDERGNYFCEFLLDGLLRGDTVSRYQAYATGRQWGWLSADDVRAMENMNPLPDETGKIYLVPMNMIPADQVGAGFSAPTPQAPSKLPASEPAAASMREFRQKRSIAGRKRIAAAYHRLFAVAAADVVKRETQDVLAKAKKILIDKSAEKGFADWTEDYYADEIDPYYRKKFKPIFWSYAEEIQAMSAEEVGGPVGLSSSMEKFLGAYLGVAVAGYVGSSIGQIGQIVRESFAAGKDPTIDLEVRFSEWYEKRAEKVAARETIQEKNAIARETYRENGVSRVVWMNTSSAPCPFCEELDGQIVGIEDSFVPANEDFQPEGAEKPLKNSHETFHPPLHGGCVCEVMAAG